jgi:hypothetical protein
MSVEQPQNILLAVLSWQWISMPMTASYRSSAAPLPPATGAVVTPRLFDV